jgi:hypothetical protein
MSDRVARRSGGRDPGSAEAGGSNAHARTTGTGIAGDAVTCTEAPDELARNVEFLGREMRGQFAGAVAPLRVIQQVEQHVDFPPVQVPVGRPAQFFAGTKEAFDPDELAEQTAVVATQRFRQKRGAGADQGGTRRLRPFRASPGKHELERGGLQRTRLIPSNPTLHFRTAEAAVWTRRLTLQPLPAQPHVFQFAGVIFAGGVSEREVVGFARLPEEAGELGAGFRGAGEFVPQPRAQFRGLPAQPGKQRDGGVGRIFGQQLEDEPVDAIFVGGGHGRHGSWGIVAGIVLARVTRTAVARC